MIFALKDWRNDARFHCTASQRSDWLRLTSNFVSGPLFPNLASRAQSCYPSLRTMPLYLPASQWYEFILFNKTTMKRNIRKCFVIFMLLLIYPIIFAHSNKESHRLPSISARNRKTLRNSTLFIRSQNPSSKNKRKSKLRRKLKHNHEKYRRTWVPRIRRCRSRTDCLLLLIHDNASGHRAHQYFQGLAHWSQRRLRRKL